MNPALFFIFTLVASVALVTVMMHLSRPDNPAHKSGCDGCRFYRPEPMDFFISGYHRYAKCGRPDSSAHYASVERASGFEVLGVCGPEAKHFEAK